MSIHYTEINGNKIEYELTRKRIKNINIRIRADGSVAVSSPKGIRLEVIEAFVDANAASIQRAREKYAKSSNNLSENETRLLGKRYKIVTVCENKTGASIGETEIILAIKNPSDNAEKEKVLCNLKMSVCKDTVLPICQSLLPEFEKAIGGVPEISFRSMKTRWGSCNPKKKRIHFSIMLADEPIEFIEYVVLHEFTHFLRADHSAEFYKLLSSRMPDYANRKKLCGKTE